MENKKITKKEYFEIIRGAIDAIEIDNKESILEFVDHEIELLSKKRTALTPTQKENEVIIENIYDILANIGEAVTTTELIERAELEYTSQKVSALLKKLVDAERIYKVTKGKKSYFSVEPITIE